MQGPEEKATNRNTATASAIPSSPGYCSEALNPKYNTNLHINSCNTYYQYEILPRYILRYSMRCCAKSRIIHRIGHYLDHDIDHEITI